MNIKRYIISILLFMIFINICCKGNDSAGTRNFIMGVGPVWKWYYGELEDKTVPTPTVDTIRDMMPKITDAGEMVLAQTGWRADTLGDVPSYFDDLINIWTGTIVLDTAIEYEHVSYGINFFNQGTGAAEVATPVDTDNDWTNNTDAPVKYQQVALALCDAPYHARYIALALEVNIYSHYNQADYIYFIEHVYIPVYDAIKSFDSSIKVFVTFQLEQCKGLGDASIWGYIPGVHWSLLDHYNGKLDIIAFTTYPEFIYDNPGLIPDDYYTSISENLPGNLKAKPLAFVEMGWSDKESNTASQQVQVEFLNRFFRLTGNLDIEYVNWVFLHDEHTSPVNPKLKLGLFDYNGNERPVWSLWKTLKEKIRID